MSSETVPIVTAMKELEEGLSQPPDSSSPETKKWLAIVRQRVNNLASIYKDEMMPRLAEVFEQIREEDVTLQPRIEQLQEEDRLILQAIETGKTAVESLDEEACLDNQQINGLVDQLKSLIERIRSHRHDITHWLNEAFLRDRGFPSG